MAVLFPLREVGRDGEGDVETGVADDARDGRGLSETKGEAAREMSPPGFGAYEETNENGQTSE